MTLLVKQFLKKLSLTRQELARQNLAKGDSIANSNHNKQMLPALILRSSGSVTLNQAEVIIEKQLTSNIVSSVGRLSCEMPQVFDWSFNLTDMYGVDNFYFQTYPLYEDCNTNKPNSFNLSDRYIPLTQSYAALYLPDSGNSNPMLGLLHYPLANTTGFVLPASVPLIFYTSYYSFTYSLAKSAESSYGHQKKSLLADVFGEALLGILVNGDKEASGYSLDAGYNQQLNPKLSTAVQAEYFATDDVNVVLPYSDTYKALTTNMPCSLKPYLHVPPEILYNCYDGSHKPYTAKNNDLIPLVTGTKIISCRTFLI